MQAFLASLGDIPFTQDAAVLAEKSRDYFWFSPILKAELEGLTADVVITPRDEADVLRVAALAAQHRVPITARGMGTGNFGQAVPLAGGVVLDMTQLNNMLWVKPGAARAQAGIVVEAFDTATCESGQELRMHPSTKRFATLGGFMAGGHAGIGSVTYGILRDRGNILGLKLITIEETPRVLEIRGDELTTVHHAYGVNGIITEVEMPLAPAYAWRDVVVSFDDFIAAARFGLSVAVADGIVKKLVSPLAAPLVAHFSALQDVLPSAKPIVIAMVAPQSLEAFEALVQEHGGTVCLNVDEGGYKSTPLYEFTWGHTTLQVLNRDPSVTYLITIFRGENPLEQVRLLHEGWGEVAPLHLELKRINGGMAIEGIPVFRFESKAQVESYAQAWEALGVKIANPHSYFLQNGGMHKIDQAQIAFKRAVDPHGLMNPGKIAGFDEISGAPGGATELKASGWAY
jgi:FAD/FMN-containing dehydrogenase